MLNFEKKLYMRLSILMVLFTVFFYNAKSVAQPCNSDLVNDEPLGYKMRGNRCEGFYRSTVSAPSFDLASCTLGEFIFSNQNNELITLKLPTGAPDDVLVRAQGLSRLLYYRMDTKLSGGQLLAWNPFDVLLKDDRTSNPENIGLLAFRGHGNSRIYYVISAMSNHISHKSESVVLKFVGNQVPEFLRWRVDGGNWQRKQGPFFAGMPTRIELSNLSKGQHTLEVEFRGRNQPRIIPFRYTIYL